MNLTRARVLIPAAVLTALALTGCSGSGNDGDSGGSGGSGGDASYAGEAPAARDGDVAPEALAGGGTAGSVTDPVTGSAAGSDDSDAAAEPGSADGTEPLSTQEQSLIRTGNVALRADDVGRAQIRVQKVVDRYAGQVSDEDTQSDDDGTPTYTRMELRIPTKDFDKAVRELKGAGDLESATTKQQDVTDQVIDVRTRLAVQKRSIARITVLFQQAKTIRDIMAIEAELSQRQAELESLEQQSAQLANVTSMSTIVVSIDETPTDKPARDDTTDDAGFLAGLSAGWGALATFAVGAATVVGAVLPWAVALAVVAIPVLLLVRSARRRTPSVAVETSQPSE
ncbi:DUF4349 domain-containing protein [Nocardioides sp. URHA0020]|uniref:DUF4349 domain-containing protein n=1 Tax=Nocardioides sp. URHA0020 TaxID=1380392 RepID=UPI00048BF35E|nr:DUF4349 domain-containing protein [Nocardioides sp. URHA0020]